MAGSPLPTPTSDLGPALLVGVVAGILGGAWGPARDVLSALPMLAVLALVVVGYLGARLGGSPRQVRATTLLAGGLWGLLVAGVSAGLLAPPPVVGIAVLLGGAATLVAAVAGARGRGGGLLVAAAGLGALGLTGLVAAGGAGGSDLGRVGAALLALAAAGGSAGWAGGAGGGRALPLLTHLGAAVLLTLLALV